MYRGDDYWVGYLSQTAAIAARADDPQPILKSALRAFLRERPAGDRLAAEVRSTLKEKT